LFAAKNLDVAERLQTHPSLLSRKSNRPKLEDLKKMDLSKMLTNETAEVKNACFLMLGIF
jgi:U3 small nucleolar RNA-associated protein 11